MIDENLEAFKTAEVAYKQAMDALQEAHDSPEYRLKFFYSSTCHIALACEIYMKSIDLSLWGHGLWKDLFKKVPDDVQREITEDYNKISENSQQTQEILQALDKVAFQTSFSSIDFSIKKVLKVLNKNFELFRYPYEEKFTKEFERRIAQNAVYHPYFVLKAIREYQLKRHQDWPTLVNEL